MAGKTDVKVESRIIEIHNWTKLIQVPVKWKKLREPKLTHNQLVVPDKELEWLVKNFPAFYVT
jgi:hypothetical protein